MLSNKIGLPNDLIFILRLDSLQKASPQLTTKLAGYTVAYPNQQEFHSLKSEIFVRHDYYLDFLADPDNETPVTRVVDIGAHIGLSVLYFAKQYPLAHIIAVEPHPDALEYLQHNIWQNHLDERVEIIAAAVVPQSQTGTPTTLHTDPTDGWWSTTSTHPGAWTGDQDTQALTVSSISLDSIINQPTDLVKIDIEGAEQALLESQTATTLGYIQNLLVEFHPHPTQSLPKLLDFLERHGFRNITLWQNGKPVQAKFTHNRLVLLSAHR